MRYNILINQQKLSHALTVVTTRKERANPMPENKFVRFRFSVPRMDQDVLAWAQAQANLSISLRALIRDSIRTHGVVDATCLPVTPVRASVDTTVPTTPVSEPIRPKMRPRAAAQEAPTPAPQTRDAVPIPEPAPVAPPQERTPPRAANPGPAPTREQSQILEDMLMT